MRQNRLHVAFMAVPAHGHVNPTLPLAAELVARGHQVSYATNEAFAPQVAETGATPMLYTSTFPSFDKPGEQITDDVGAGMTLFLDELIAVLPQVAAAYVGETPDVVVYDIGAWQAPILAERWGVPAIQVSPTFVAYDGMAEDFGWDVRVQADPAIRAFTARFEEYVATLDVSLTPAQIQAEPRRCVVMLPRAFQLKAELVADSYTFVGPTPADRATLGDWQAPEDKPVLLVTLGSAYNNQPEFFRTCMTAFADLDWYVVMAIGRHIQPAALGPAPANFEIHQWVPQDRVLSAASAFVTHAGMGSTMGGLYHAVPLIAVPQAVEQFITGARIGELGLGKHIPREQVTADVLRAALLEVTTDQGIADSLRGMREEILASGGVRLAADIIESEARS